MVCVWCTMYELDTTQSLCHIFCWIHLLIKLYICIHILLTMWNSWIHYEFLLYAPLFLSLLRSVSSYIPWKMRRQKSSCVAFFVFLNIKIKYFMNFYKASCILTFQRTYDLFSQFNSMHNCSLIIVLLEQHRWTHKFEGKKHCSTRLHCLSIAHI